MSSTRFTPGGGSRGSSREGSSPDEKAYGISSDYLGEASDFSSGSKMGKTVGDHARAKAILDLRSALMTILDTRGLLSTTIDIASADFIVGELAEIIFMREHGMQLLLDALLEGEFHLETSGASMIKDLHFAKSLFIPGYSIAKVTGNIDVEKELTRDGYCIRRKS